MANPHAILAIVGAALAALTAVLTPTAFMIVPAGFALVVGIMITLKHKDNRMVMAGGAIAALTGLLGALGALGGINFAGLGPSFSWLSVNMASALIIFANLEIAATMLKTRWAELPQAGAIGTAVALGAAALLAFIFNGDLGNLFSAMPFVIAVLALVGLYPAITALKA